MNMIVTEADPVTAAQERLGELQKTHAELRATKPEIAHRAQLGDTSAMRELERLNDKLEQLDKQIDTATAAATGAEQARQAADQAKRDARHAASLARAIEIGGQTIAAARQFDDALGHVATTAKIYRDLVRELSATRMAPPRVVRDADSPGSFERAAAAAGLDRMFGIYVPRHHAMTMTDHITRLLGPLKPKE